MGAAPVSGVSLVDMINNRIIVLIYGIQWGVAGEAAATTLSRGATKRVLPAPVPQRKMDDLSKETQSLQ